MSSDNYSIKTDREIQYNFFYLHRPGIEPLEMKNPGAASGVQLFLQSSCLKVSDEYVPYRHLYLSTGIFNTKS